MPDYKSMYFTLLRAQCEAIELLERAAQQAEEIVMSAGDDHPADSPKE